MSVIEEPALLERDAELASLEELVAGIRGDGNRLLVIEGPAGIGKTRLLVEARARAEATGIEVLWARGSELEHEFGYGVVRQLFERLLDSMSQEEREDVLAGAAAPAASVLAPPCRPRITAATRRSPRCMACTGRRRTSPSGDRCCL